MVTSIATKTLDIPSWLIKQAHVADATPPAAPRQGPPRLRDISGAIAQLGERLNGIQEVGGSIPPGSTKFSGTHPQSFAPR